MFRLLERGTDSHYYNLLDDYIFFNKILPKTLRWIRLQQALEVIFSIRVLNNVNINGKLKKLGNLAQAILKNMLLNFQGKK